MQDSLPKHGYAPLKDLLVQTSPGKSLIFGVIALTLAEAALSLVLPLQTQTLLDNLAGGVDSGLVAVLTLILLFSALADGGLNYLLGKLGNRQKHSLRKQLLSKLFSLPMTFFDKTPSGEPANRLVKDTELIEDLVSQHFVLLISGVTMLIGSLVILSWLDWRLTAVLFATVLLGFLIILPVAMKLTKLSKDIQDKEASLLARLSEVFANMRLLRSQAATYQETRRNQATIGELYQLSMKETRIHAVMAPVINLSIMLAIVIILGYGGALVSQGEISLGTFIAFIMYVFNIVMPVVQLTMFIGGLNKAAGAAVRIHELLAEQSIKSRGNKVCLRHSPIHFKDLHFAYPNKPLLFEALNLTLPAGKTTALVGESGAGKSTLFELLQGFYSPQQGDVYLGDIPFNDIALTSICQQTGYVAQDSPLLSGSLRENLCYGLHPMPSDNKIHQALEQAQMQQVMQDLPQGLDTQLGEKGVNLSGGQKQRVAIARAILKNPALLLLDEATASQDAQTEDQLQQSLKQLCKGRTTLIAAHRLNTVLDADQILVLKGGKVIDAGKHQELMQTQSYYRELVEKQLAVSA